MSKLSDAIKATWAGVVPAARHLNYTDIRMDVSDVPHAMPVQRQVKMQATFGTRVMISDDLNLGSMDAILNDVKRAVIEDVFGEFRPIINEIRIASYQDDKAEIARLVGILERQMFEV